MRSSFVRIEVVSPFVKIDDFVCIEDLLPAYEFRFKTEISNAKYT